MTKPMTFELFVIREYRIFGTIQYKHIDYLLFGKFLVLRRKVELL